MLNPLANGKIQGLFKDFMCFSSTFQDKFYFQGLFKTDLYIQVIFKPVRTLMDHNNLNNKFGRGLHQDYLCQIIFKLGQSLLTRRFSKFSF